VFRSVFWTFFDAEGEGRGVDNPFSPGLGGGGGGIETSLPAQKNS